MENEEIIIAVKGFNLDWTCGGDKFEVGKTYEHKGDVKVSKSGYHATVNPFHVWSHYPPTNSIYALVECSGEISKESNRDRKIACGKLTIKAELKLSELIKYGVKWIFSRVNFDPTTAAAGDCSNAAASGDYSTAAAAGDCSNAAASGDCSTAATSGHCSNAAASGDCSTAATSGHCSTAAAAGDYSTAATSGHYSTAAAAGDYSTAATSGHYSNAAASGDCSTAATSGHCSTAAVAGKNSVALAFGWRSKTKASKGSAIVCVYKDQEGNLIHAKAAIAGKDVKADTWYTLDENGNFVEVG